MEIPQSFQILGHTITVEFSDSLYVDESAYGLSRFEKNIITLATGEFSRSLIEQTFCHEVIHFILHYMAEGKLNTNEKFVDLMGQFLHQYETTKVTGETNGSNT